MGLTGMFFRGKPPPPRRPVSVEEAVSEKLEAKAEREVMANLVLDLWQTFLAAFREDERAHEEAEFRTAVGDLPEAADALGPERAANEWLQRRILAALVTELPERLAALHARVDDLAATCGARDQELNTVKLSSSWQSDELERCRTMIGQALRGRETTLPSGGVQPLISELLATLLNVQRPPPPTKAHEGRRAKNRATTGAGDEAEAEKPKRHTSQRVSGDPVIAGVQKILREVLAGEASAGRLARIIDDRDLARQLADLAAEHRTYRQTLIRIGLLPKDGAPRDEAGKDGG